jgi:hypothetical protein
VLRRLIFELDHALSLGVDQAFRRAAEEMMADPVVSQGMDASSYARESGSASAGVAAMIDETTLPMFVKTLGQACERAVVVLVVDGGGAAEYGFEGGAAKKGKLPDHSLQWLLDAEDPKKWLPKNCVLALTARPAGKVGEFMAKHMGEDGGGGGAGKPGAPGPPKPGAAAGKGGPGAALDPRTVQGGGCVTSKGAYRCCCPCATAALLRNVHYCCPCPCASLDQRYSPTPARLQQGVLQCSQSV